MKKMAALALALLPIALAGCVQTHMETIIQKDGSGTFSLDYAMSQQVAEAFKELSALDMPGKNDMGDAPSLEDFDKAEIEKACQEHGVKLKKFDRTTVDGKQKVEIVMEFKHLNDLDGALGSVKDQGGMKLFKTGEGNYAIKMVKQESAAEEAPEGPEDYESAAEAMKDFDPQAMGKSMEIMGKLMGSISELDVAMRLTVPGQVISHNAQRVEGNTLIWEINSSNMMTAAGGMEPDIVFSGKGLKIDAPAWSE